MAPDAPARATRIELPFAGPFERAPALGLLAAHAVPGLEVVDIAAGTVTRLLRAPSGPVAVTVALGGDRVVVTVGSTHPADVAAVAATVRFWFDLDQVPEHVAAVLGDDSIVGALVRLRPGLRIIGHPDGYEAAVCTVLGQQVSLASARTFTRRLAAAFGTSGPEGLRLFPPAPVVAGIPVEELRRTVGLTGARARTVLAVAEAFAAGLVLEPGVDAAGARAALLAIPGVGPWTAGYLAVRALGDRDAFPAGDLVLRRALGVRSAAEATALAEAWRPLRAYALLHLWTSTTYS